jgi:hypothetical protein
MRGPTRLISLLYTADQRERSRFNPATIDFEPNHKPSVPRNEIERGAIQSDDKSSHSKGADPKGLIAPTAWPMRDHSSRALGHTKRSMENQ